MSKPIVRAPRAEDPYGIGPVRTLAAPILALVGLVLVALVTISVMNGQVPFVGGKTGSNGNGNGTGNGDGGPALTPAPSNVVIVPEVTFKGSIVYAKAGNIWVQTGKDVRQLTSSGGDSMPSWSSDGQWIYYVQTNDGEGLWPVRGSSTKFVLAIPDLMRVPADGSAKPERLATGKFKDGRYTWSYWIRQPVLSPDGTTIAMVTDAPNPEKSNVVLQFFDTTTKKVKRAGVPESGLLGHQDPEWRPDGQYLLYVKNGRDGTRGAPIIVRYEPATKKTKSITTAGYLNPAYSPDGRYIAATKTSSLGTDVVILDGSNGRELLRLTNDDSSWAPTWSPAGDGVAFLHLDGSTVDLRLARLEGVGPDWTIKETVPLTEVSGLDANSRPDWFIPASELPAPTPTPTPPPTPSAAASPSPAP
jgi:dipeptidyl aminopeptidase/acylaminoacyl peptidase